MYVHVTLTGLHWLHPHTADHSWPGVSRWLRFPCCGRRFACDLCHEEQTDGHEMKWAQRMVCGYCSHEQPLGEQCKHCGKRIARSARGALGAATTHWQVCPSLAPTPSPNPAQSRHSAVVRSAKAGLMCREPDGQWAVSMFFTWICVLLSGALLHV